MITEEHLKHWTGEILYALNGIQKEITKSGFGPTTGEMIHGDYLSLEYLREKESTIRRLLGCITWDIMKDSEQMNEDENRGRILTQLFPGVDWRYIEYIAVKQMGDELKTHIVNEHLGKELNKK